ncbi:MAG: hypothetical protein RL173_982 [Fibrobacterota bacterium]|jgi:cobalt/nickel transport protein
MKTKTTNVLLAGATVALSVLPLVCSRPATGEAFSGSDGQVGAVIEQLRPGYRLWFSPLWVPPSSEIESSLFGLQAAIGAGALCYALGYLRGSSNRMKDPNA